LRGFVRAPRGPTSRPESQTSSNDWRLRPRPRPSRCLGLPGPRRLNPCHCGVPDPRTSRRVRVRATPSRLRGPVRPQPPPLQPRHRHLRVEARCPRERMPLQRPRLQPRPRRHPHLRRGAGRPRDRTRLCRFRLRRAALTSPPEPRAPRVRSGRRPHQQMPLHPRRLLPHQARRPLRIPRRPRHRPLGPPLGLMRVRRGHPYRPEAQWSVRHRPARRSPPRHDRLPHRRARRRPPLPLRRPWLKCATR
jgi:hypothetical protein